MSRLTTSLIPQELAIIGDAILHQHVLHNGGSHLKDSDSAGERECRLHDLKVCANSNWVCDGGAGGLELSVGPEKRWELGCSTGPLSCLSAANAQNHGALPPPHGVERNKSCQPDLTDTKTLLFLRNHEGTKDYGGCCDLIAHRPAEHTDMTINSSLEKNNCPVFVETCSDSEILLKYCEYAIPSCTSEAQLRDHAILTWPKLSSNLASSKSLAESITTDSRGCSSSTSSPAVFPSSSSTGNITLLQCANIEVATGGDLVEEKNGASSHPCSDFSGSKWHPALPTGEGSKPAHLLSRNVNSSAVPHGEHQIFLVPHQKNWRLSKSGLTSPLDIEKQPKRNTEDKAAQLYPYNAAYEQNDSNINRSKFTVLEDSPVTSPMLQFSHRVGIDGILPEKKQPPGLFRY